MSLSIHLTEEALQEEAEAYLYYEVEQEGLGERFLGDVEATLKKVSENPAYYSYSDDTKTMRDISLIHFPFVIIYEVKSERIEIYHIHHTKKKLE
jgi:hypothetical protein